MIRIFNIIFFLSFLYSCGSATEGFKLKKGNTGDEFLVEKKNPLVLPPNFNELPQPGSTNVSIENKEGSFENKILNTKKVDNNENTISDSTSTEDFILKNIKKNESDQ
tara:strand:+ start:820 stop:1143 length:324 start_codon:yes stop_codon:yes gene_type:complete